MLVLARESRGLTQSEVARLLGVSQGYVSKTESGLLEPTDDALSKLAGLLDYPEPFFRLADPVYGPGVTEFWHRKRQAATAKQMRRVYAEINKRIIHIGRLLRSAELPETFQRFDVDEFDGPSDVARAVRNAWNLPQGPVRTSRAPSRTLAGSWSAATSGQGSSTPSADGCPGCPRCSS